MESYNALHTDFYQLNMMQTYFNKGLHEKRGVFDMFFRKLPFGNGFAVFAGLEEILNYLENLKFTESDLDYLADKGFGEDFFNLLRDFKFQGDVYSVKEGEIVFPNEPLLTIEGTIFEAMLVETAILNIFNHEALIATKAARIREVSGNKSLAEFGARRAHGFGAALRGTRATYIGGFDGTSLVEAGKRFGIPVIGTMSHAFVQSFEDELDSFIAYGEENEGNVILLVDTYDTLKIGVPNAIKAAKILSKKGIKVDGIRLDSGDLAYLSKEARKMLDESGLQDIKIVASSDLDENIIANLELQGGKIDTYAVGTKVITAYDQPALGGVYKLSEIIEEGIRIPKIKVSDNVEKIITPGRKKLYRIINQKTGKAEADYITRFIEVLPPEGENLLLFDPIHTWKKKTVEKFYAVELQEQVMDKGKRMKEDPQIEEIREYKKMALNQFWDEHKRLVNPQEYYVDLSSELWELKDKMIKERRKN